MKKKALAFALSMALCFGAALPAFAADGETNTQTPESASQVTHSYAAYQIFTGRLEVIDGKQVLTDIKWGSDATDVVKAAIAAKVTPIDSDKNPVDTTKREATAEEYARGIQLQYASSQTIGEGAEVIAAEINKVVTGDGTELSGKTIPNGATGWYLIVDTTKGLDGDYSVYLDRAQLQFYTENGEVTINEKRSSIEINKEVQDINDTVTSARVTYKDEEWGETADYDFGDDVPFKVTATLPADFDTYSTYEYTFSDRQSKGLVFKADTVKVYKNTIDDANEIDVKFYEVKEDANQHSFKVIFKNIKDKDLKLVQSDTLILSYKSTLTGEFVEYGFNGNKNECRIEFENDKGGKGKTPWDIAIVFTFKPVINKTDGTAALKGAEFEFSKQFKDETSNFGFRLLEKFTGDGTSTFELKGIDDGIYKIEETKAPAGYNSIKPIYFEVVADHNDEGLQSLTVYEMKDEIVKDEATGEETLVLTQGAMIGKVDKDGKSEGNWKLFKTVDRERKTEKTEDFGNINVEVINQEGVVLPSTGGIGTTIFYVVGGVLVVGAVVLLIVRRKMRTEEE